MEIINLGEGQFEVYGSQDEPYNLMLDEMYGAYCDCEWSLKGPGNSKQLPCKHINACKELKDGKSRLQ